MSVKLQRIDACRWRIPREGKMRTDGLIYASEAMIDYLQQEQALEQVRNVATLPGIVGPSIAMPDIHWGYGFPIGGVAAFDPDTGVVSPGGVGYDINCGVRLLRTSLQAGELAGRVRELADGLFRNIPSGVGSERRDLRLKPQEIRRVLERGAAWATAEGFGSAEDLRYIEEGGSLSGVDPDMLSDRARERGQSQLGTLGSGNHFVEVQRVEEIFDEALAAALGLFRDQVVVSIHTGSRGLGYQVCDDYIKVMLKASATYGIELVDRQLCCAPLTSPEAARYLSAMYGAANYAFANRQLITHWVRQTFQQTLGLSEGALRMGVVYDVCHNIAKWERHLVEGQPRRLCVHRKGATRAFPPGHPDIPEAYRAVGQPALVPGDMGRYSYVLVGTEAGLAESYGSICHGAGRLLSRHQSKKAARGHNIERELEDRGIILRAASRATVAEEISEAYKDVMEVVQVVQQAGIGRIVARLRPLAVVKG